MVWHNFTEKQRNKIIVLCVDNLCKISDDDDLYDKPPLYLMRILAILDYMLFQYNDPPVELLTQVILLMKNFAWFFLSIN